MSFCHILETLGGVLIEEFWDQVDLMGRSVGIILIVALFGKTQHSVGDHIP